jgi:uncharacterized protein (TIGR03435 family)
MSTERQKQASRANGSKSRGATTPKGKLASSRNAIAHGMLSTTIVLKGESTDRFLGLLTDLLEEFQPQTPFEESLIENMAVARWRQMRVWGMEKAAMEHEMRRLGEMSNLAALDPSGQAATRAAIAFRTLSDDSRSLELINRYESRYDRQYLRAHRRFLEVCDRRTPSAPPANPEKAIFPFEPKPSIPEKVIINERTPEVPANEHPVQYNRSIMPCVRLAFAAMLTVSALAAQPPDLQFEVASVKPAQPGAQGVVLRSAPGHRRFIAANETLAEIVMVAYRIREDHFPGEPKWMAADRWDINTEAERPYSPEELRIMLLNLLKERFKLRTHFETKERPVYVMSVDKTGMKMTPDEIGNSGDRSIEESGNRKWTAKFVPMDYLAWLLSVHLDRPIIDRTGLKGTWDFTLSWTPVLSAGPADDAGDNSGPGLLEAVRKQLGLQLEPGTAPVGRLVIDHVEKPVGN